MSKQNNIYKGHLKHGVLFFARKAFSFMKECDFYEFH